MIRSNSDIPPLLQQLLRSPQLIANMPNTISTQRQPHGHIPTGRDARPGQDIHDDPSTLDHIAQLVVIDSAERPPDRLDGRVAVLVAHGAGGEQAVPAAGVQEPGAEVARLDDDGGDPERRHLVAQRLREPRHGPLRRRVVRVRRPALPARDAAEGRDDAAGAAETLRPHVVQCVARHVHGAEYVGCEGGLDLFGSDVMERERGLVPSD